MSEATAWRSFLREINTPSDFEADPYGALTNQLSHAFFALVLACILCVASFFLFHEFPDKLLVGSLVTVPYALNELINQRWKGRDTIADVAFFFIGGNSVLASLSETKIDGEAVLEPSVWGFSLSALALIVMLLFHIRPRVKAKYAQNK